MACKMKFDFILHAIFYCVCFYFIPLFKALPTKLFIFAARTNNTYI